MTRYKRIVATTLAALLACQAGALAASINIADYAEARPGQTIAIPVSVFDSGNLAGLNLRMDYNPDVFQFLSVEPGTPLTASSWYLDSHEPPEASGSLNVVAFSLDGAPVAGSDEGMFIIRMQVNPDAAPGEYELRFSSPITVSVDTTMPSSGLADASGNSLAHNQESGSVTVVTPVEGDLNADGVVDYADLFLFSEEWHENPPASPEADRDSNQECDAQDLRMLIEVWRD